MKTQIFSTVRTIKTKFDTEMEVGSIFTEHECEATGIKLIKEEPQGKLNRMCGVQRTVIVCGDEPIKYISEQVFEAFKKLMK